MIAGFYSIRIPFFSTIKLLGTLYLVLPQFKGSLALYVLVRSDVLMSILFVLLTFFLQIEPKLVPLVEQIEKLVETKVKVCY